MTELEFGQRLKRFRREKSMTQQELADLLGVSNKSVSRWESGSYPDVATLGPLAKALGVTVDDLLGETPPLRALGRADWQNLLSFAFALGGGVLFFLLALFVPVPLCLFIYLGCLAYGVYLQKNYTCHSRWFYAGVTVMNLFVYLRLFSFVLALGVPKLTSMLQDIFIFFQSGPHFQMLPQVFLQLLPALLPYLGLTALATAITTLLSLRYGNGRQAFSLVRPSLSFVRPAPAKLLPVLCPLLAAAYWCLFYSVALPEWTYLNQVSLFYALLGLLALLSLIWLLAVRRPWMLLPAGMSLLLSALYPSLLRYPLCYSGLTGNLLANTPGLNDGAYTPIGRPTVLLFLLAAVLAALYLLCCFIQIRPAKPKTE